MLSAFSEAWSFNYRFRNADCELKQLVKLGNNDSGFLHAMSGM
jgi:hypothetical protein